MKLIVGLGNVGREYENSRHNIGWQIAGTLAQNLGIELQEKVKFHAQAGKGSVGREEVVLAKPITMMNGSGQAVRALIDFYKLEPKDILVIHDELDIPFGIIKTKHGGSDGLHNGLASITKHIGPNYWRLRIGVDHQPREIPNGADFVLARFNPEEEAKLPQILNISTELIRSLLDKKFEVTSRKT